MSFSNRNFNIIPIIKQKEREKELTSIQYLCYSYLLSHSQWNGKDNDRHYYLYKNDMPSITNICKQLGISRNSWYRSLEALSSIPLSEEAAIKLSNSPDYFDTGKNKHLYTYIKDFGNYYKIGWKSTYAPIDIKTLKKLISYGSVIQHGGFIIEVIGALYHYKLYMGERNKKADITISNLCKFFFGNQKNKGNYEIIDLFLGIYEMTGMISTHRETRKTYNHTHTVLIIDEVRLKMDSYYLCEDDEVEAMSYENLVKAVQESRLHSNNLIANMQEEKRKKKTQIYIDKQSIYKMDMETGEITYICGKEDQPDLYNLLERQEEIKKLVDSSKK